MVQPIPEGVSTVVPHLSIRGAKKAIEFYQAAFGAEVALMMPMGEDLVGYADLKIAGSRIYLADAMPGWGPVKSPSELKGTTVTMHLWVEDVDAVFARAVAAGAKVVMPVGDQFWGDRYGMVEDPFGHTWAIATRKEELTAEEMMRRGQEAMASMPPPPPPSAPKPSPKPSPKPRKKGLPTAARPKAVARPAAKAIEPRPAVSSRPAASPAPPDDKGAKKPKKDKKGKKSKKDKKSKKSKKDKKRKKKSKR
ncbi:MAG: VOC family protein [Vicinamibacteria bacterium]|nr:VOC family protein [Vicinamibacteria bacterium]